MTSSDKHNRPASEKWDFWIDGEHTPSLNMAIDEALLLSAADRKRPLLRIYRWDRPSVSIGYVQNYACAPSKKFAVVRRPTGGGVVYHDHDFTYTGVFPPDHWFNGLDRTASYSWINRSVLDALAECSMRVKLTDTEIGHSVNRGTMVCFTNPTRYDILMDEQKIAGSAQRRTRNGILHQGSLHFGDELPLAREELTKAFKKGFSAVIGAEFASFTPGRKLLVQAEKLASEKYSTDEWNRRR